MKGYHLLTLRCSALLGGDPTIAITDLDAIRVRPVARWWLVQLVGVESTERSDLSLVVETHVAGQLVALIALIAVYHSLRVMPPQLGKSVLQI